MPMYETENSLDEKTKDMSRARQSLIEEMQAIMFYDERLDATKDSVLKDVIRHNRDDEKEHFSLLLEYLRRNDPELDRELKEILFSKKELKELGD
ncbi:ferritin [Ferroplasma sp.]|uniref:ferritin family protein n=1 Tax=Ferroplasma sp. TaxID=2591003 RepID=UPI00260C90E3|nr:ferritin [Ferroplasma sp.]MCL4453299.1 ferritin [Candidatus Thermoplasmatota archaeon]